MIYCALSAPTMNIEANISFIINWVYAKKIESEPIVSVVDKILESQENVFVKKEIPLSNSAERFERKMMLFILALVATGSAFFNHLFFVVLGLVLTPLVVYQKQRIIRLFRRRNLWKHGMP